VVASDDYPLASKTSVCAEVRAGADEHVRISAERFSDTPFQWGRSWLQHARSHVSFSVEWL